MHSGHPSVNVFGIDILRSVRAKLHRALYFTNTHCLRNFDQALSFLLFFFIYFFFCYQAGDPNSDHNCWERPEDMDTPRTVHQINASSPGTEVAAETAAALAAASIVFKDDDAVYSEKLLDTAMTVQRFPNSITELGRHFNPYFRKNSLLDSRQYNTDRSPRQIYW